MNKEKYTQLPKDWQWVKLGEIVSLLGDGLHGTPEYSENGEYYFINGNNLSDGKILIKENTKRVSIKEYEKYKKQLNDKTILVSINGTIGNVAFYKNEKVILGKSACYFNVIDSVDKHYVRLLLTGQRFLNYAHSTSTGSTIKNVSLKSMREFKIPLPPKPTQQSIISKIEELFSELDKGIENLRLAQQQLKTYRQSVLKWAFEGKLTNENVKEGELPKGWKWMKLGDVAKKKSIKALPADYPEAKFIGMDCIEPHTLKPNFLYDFKEFKSAGNYFKTNQVLYGRMRPYLNKVYRAEFDGTCSGEFIILDCGELFNPDLLKYILHSKGFVSYANSITTGDRPRISYEEISDYDIPVAPIDEQNKIVQGIECRLSVVDKMEESINQSLQQSEALRQSILKKAFEGRLV